ncbi:hypothetical protein Tco_1262600 [Tanacetum coccineum]
MFSLGEKVMAAPIISILLDSSEEGVAAPEVGAVSITSPAEVLDMVDYSFFASDPSEDSLPPAPAPDLPLVLPFLCSDDSEADSKSEPTEQRPERHESLAAHDAMVSRWRDMFPLALVVASPGIRRWPVILIRPDEAIPFGQPYRTHLNGPHKLLTARKRVRPFLASRLVWRRVSHRSSDHHSSPDFIQTHLLPVHLRILQTHLLQVHLQIHCQIHHQFILQGLMHQAFRRWRSASLSTPYPPTTLESSLDSSFERSLDSSLLSVGPSRKRCISLITSVPSSTSVSRSIAPTHANLLPPHKRFRDSYSLEDIKEDHIEIGTADGEFVVDLGIGDGVGAHTEYGIGMGVEIAASVLGRMMRSLRQRPVRGDVPGLEDIIYDIVHYMSEVPLDRIIEFETTQRQLEVGQLIASGERVGLTDTIWRLGRENLRVRALLSIERDRVENLRRHMALSQEDFRQIHRDRDDARRRRRRLESFDMTITRSEMTPEAIKDLIAQRVAEALANYEATRAANALKAEIQSQNGSDDDNENGRNGNGGNRNSGNGNGNNGDGGNNGNGNLNENGKGVMPVARVCTYQDFVKCQQLKFKGTKGVVGLTRWFEKMETVFHISNCLEVYQVKYATCTLLESALTWWNSHKRTIRVDVAFSMTWRDLMKLMMEVYCPRNEIQIMETELLMCVFYKL